MSRLGGAANARVSFRDPPNFYDNDDDDELDAESEEQERLLSEKHGEAGVDMGSSTRKRGGGASGSATETDQDIANELAGEASRRKKARPALTVNDLCGPRGLSKVKNEFHDRVKYQRVGARARLLRGDRGVARSKARIKQQERDAAAAYGRSLMGSYRMFCHDIFPSEAFEDVLNRIETLGAKKEVKSYLQLMRDDTRKRYLEGIYGAEKAESLLRELEHGLSHQSRDDILFQTNSRAAAAMARDNENGEESTAEEDMDTTPATSDSQQEAVVNPYGTRFTTRNANEDNANKEEKSSEEYQPDTRALEEVEANLDEPGAFNDVGSDDAKGLETECAAETLPTGINDDSVSSDNLVSKEVSGPAENLHEYKTYTSSSVALSAKEVDDKESTTPSRIGTASTQASIEDGANLVAEKRDASVVLDVESPKRSSCEDSQLIQSTDLVASENNKAEGADATRITYTEPGPPEGTKDTGKDDTEPTDEEVDKEGSNIAPGTMRKSCDKDGIPMDSSSLEEDRTDSQCRNLGRLGQPDINRNIYATQETATVVPNMTGTESECEDLPTQKGSSSIQSEPNTDMIVEYSQEEEHDLVNDFTQNSETQTFVPTQGGGISQLSMDY